MERLPHTRSCFVCGIENPLGLRLDFETDRQVVCVRLRFRPEHAGFRTAVHGGLLATVLDELMVWGTGIHTRRFAYCAEMTVRYRRPVPPETWVVGRGELVEDRRGRIFLARAELRDEAGELLTEATGKYVPVPGELTAGVLADLVEEWPAWMAPDAPRPAPPEKPTAPAEAGAGVQ
jgi:acyl-coenzyme A thioesterase PaaI-like protein